MNKVILMGRLTSDLMVKVLEKNSMVIVNGSVAVAKYAKKGEEKKADFFNIVAFDKTAEFMKNYFHKGDMIGIVGRLQTRTWDDAEGKKHYATDVLVEEAHFTGSKKETESQEQSGWQADSSDLPF